MNEKAQTIIVSLLTAALIACFGFLWNLNGTLSRMEERDVTREKALNDINLKINSIQLDLIDLRDRIIRIETKTQK